MKATGILNNFKWLLLASMLTGCAHFESPRPEIIYPAFLFSIKEAPEDLPPNVNGIARIIQFPDGQRVCEVTIREYPVCLLHEIRHCIEGLWHDERPNSEDC